MRHDSVGQYTRADRLLQRVARGGGGKAQNDLLSEFYHGYPIERLRVLLASDQSFVVNAAAWLAWELPDHVAPLIPEIAPLVLHRHQAVRRWAVRIVLLHKGPVPAAFAALAISRLSDRTALVRESVVYCLARVDVSVLERSIEHLRDRGLARDVSWLLDQLHATDPEPAVAEALSSQLRSRRLVAIAMASRLAARGRGRLLERVAAAHDRDESFVAKTELRFRAAERACSSPLPPTSCAAGRR